jgi:hypothetical protein
MRSLLLALLVSLAATACGDGATTIDAGDLPDATTGACDSGAPGIRVHLTYAPGGTMSWSDGETPLRITTTGGGSTDHRVPKTTAGSVVVVAPYPPGTQAGPASASFYAIAGGLNNYEGTVEFVADPTACIDVDLAVDLVMPTDAG